MSYAHLSWVLVAVILFLCSTDRRRYGLRLWWCLWRTLYGQ